MVREHAQLVILSVTAVAGAISTTAAAYNGRSAQDSSL